MGGGRVGAGRKPVTGLRSTHTGSECSVHVKAQLVLMEFGISESARTLPPHSAGLNKRYILHSLPVW